MPLIKTLRRLFTMFSIKKILTMGGLCLFVLLGMAAIKAPTQKLRNLKVLPKDISDAKLDSIMHTYNKALGVNCEFCHVKPRFNLGNKDSLDYFSDAEPMKENARKMMEMTISLNKTYFYFNKDVQPAYLTTITCKTCHQGEPFPPED
ncbi:MAG: c-type cytochrome [Chitinophagaceae bacterium]|nr:c-type cytochrome [Chitinophagaceae bacterium]